MPGAVIQKVARVENAIIGPDTLIEANSKVNIGGEEIDLIVNKKAARL